LHLQKFFLNTLFFANYILKYASILGNELTVFLLFVLF
jgi:hypothetical protein